MDKQFSTSIVVVVLLFGFAISLSAQNYGKPYQPFRSYQRQMAEVDFSTMPTAQMSGNIGATPRRANGDPGPGSGLLFEFAMSLSAQNYGKPYQPFRPYQRETAEVEPATMPTAQMSGNIGATSAYMQPTSLPQVYIYEPFTASTPSDTPPRRANGDPGQGSGLLFGFDMSLSAQNYGKPYQPFRPYQRGMAEVKLATMLTALRSGNIGATSAHRLPTYLPQVYIYEPFTASTPSGTPPRRAPGAGGTDKTDVENPALLPIGDGIGFLLMMGLLYMILKYVLKHDKSSTLLTKCHQMIE